MICPIDESYCLNDFCIFECFQCGDSVLSRCDICGSYCSTEIDCDCDPYGDDEEVAA